MHSTPDEDRLLYDLQERRKELNCVYEFAQVLAQPYSSVDRLLEEAVRVTPGGFRYPELTVCCVTYRDRRVCSPNYVNTDLTLAEPLRIDGTEEGELRICLLGPPERVDETAFLPEEKPLLDALAAQLSHALTHIEAEESLRALDERFAAAMANTSGGAWSWDIESNAVWTAGRFGEILGYGDGAFLDTFNEFEAILHDDDRPIVMQVLNDHLNHGAPCVVDCRVVTTSGEPRWFHIEGKAVRDESGRPVQLAGSAHDITERIAIEAELRRSRENLRNIIESDPEATLVVSDDGRIRFGNASAKVLFGRPDQQLEGQYFGIPLKGDKESQAEVVRADGVCRTATFWWARAEWEGEPVYVVRARDITESKRAESQRALLEAVIEQASETIVITDSSGTIEYVNPAFEQVTGYDRSEVIGETPRILNSGVQSREFYERMWRTILSGKVWRGRLTNQRKGGTHVQMELSLTPVVDADGEITQFVGISRDVSREVALESQIRQSQKLEAIGTLAGGIAHDFNNILTAIRGYTEMALGNTDDRAMLESDLGNVLNGASRAQELVQQILTFSRQTESQRAPLSLTVIVKEALKLLKSSIPSTIRINENLETEERAVVEADASQIHQVVMNLCTNAYHAMAKTGGELSVELTAMNFNASMRPPTLDLESGKYYCMTVRDSGCGMPPDVVERIFEPFFTTKPQGEGTGLGLSTVHGIVKQHGGGIHVSSEPGRGSTFEVYLPAADGALTDTVAQPLEALVHGQGKRALLVDDEAVIATLLEKMLSKWGIDSTVRTSPLEALALFEKKPHEFDLIITDQTMPQRTGLELVREIRRIRADIPVILATGYSEMVTDERLADAAIVDVLTKPFTMQSLSKAVKLAFGEAQPAG